MIQTASMIFAAGAVIAAGVAVYYSRVATKHARIAADANRRISQIQRGDAS